MCRDRDSRRYVNPRQTAHEPPICEDCGTSRYAEPSQSIGKPESQWFRWPVLRSEVPSMKKQGKWLPKKTTEITVRGEIAFANFHDAKGNDADVVLVIEPDNFGKASALEKRALFYVAATRAKEIIVVLGVAGEGRHTPILEDAAATETVLAKLR